VLEGRETFMDEDFLTIQNQHTPHAGRLPKWALDRPEGAYFGYYENEYGEQWVILASQEKVLLAGGDCGWDSTYELLRPPWAEIAERSYPQWPDLVMTPEERTWLLTCLASAARGFSPRIPSAESRAPGNGSLS
jgi:hypothetical protein